jgi:hypothetical protein
MPTIFHVVGDADLGIAHYDDRSQAIEDLLKMSPSDMSEFFRSTRRQEHQHRQMSPLESVLTHLQVTVPEYADGRRWNLILLATAQQPAHERDTLTTANALCEVLIEAPDAFGFPVVAEVLRVDSVSAEAFARSVSEYANNHFIPQPVILGLAGGPASATIGVLGGLLDAGLAPQLLEANRQDQNLDIEISLMEIMPDVRSWLARTRRYHALSKEFSGDEQQLCKVLSSAMRGDWLSMPSPTILADNGLRKLARRLDVPRRETGALQAGTTPDQYNAWHLAVVRMLLAEIGAGDPIALPFTETFLRVHTRDVTSGHRIALADAAKKTHINSKAKAFGDRAKVIGKKVKWQERATEVLLQSPETSPEQLAQTITNDVARLLQSWAEQAYTTEILTDPYETVFHWQFKNRPDDLPELLQPLLTTPWRKLDDLAKGSRHGLKLDLVNTLAEGLLEVGVIDDGGAEAAAVEALGLIPPATLGASGRLAVLAVGRRQFPTDDPMLEAVLSQIGDDGENQLILIASSEADPSGEGTEAVARQLADWATTRGVGTAQVCICPDPYSVIGSRGYVAEALRAMNHRQIVGIDVFVGPGTKALNIAATLASVEHAFALAADIRFWSLVPSRDEAGSIDPTHTVVVPTLSAKNGWQRLVPDATLAALVQEALDHLDLRLLLGALHQAPQHWYRVSQLVGQFATLLEASMRQVSPELAALMEQYGLDEDTLLASRLQQLNRLRGVETRLTAARMAVTISDVRTDKGDLAWRWLGKSAEALWRARVAAIKEPWHPIPALPDLRGLLSDLDLEELESWPLGHLVDEINAAVAAAVGSDSSVRLVNLTPHIVDLIPLSGDPIAIKIGGPAPRVLLDRIDLEPLRIAGAHIPTGWSRAGVDVNHLPDPEPDCLFIVSRMVAEAAAHRDDLVFPDDLVRDEFGAVVGCRRLSRIPAPV